MKAKTSKNSPVPRLYEAALEIVQGTRGVFERNGKDAREIRVPILIHGTDMRITIEAGPKIAARNAIEHAQMEASGKPAEPIVNMAKALQDAQMLLGMFCTDLHAAHSKATPGSTDWHRLSAEAKRCIDTMAALKETERLL